MSETAMDSILISTITVARNLSGYRFATTMSQNERKSVQQKIVQIAEQNLLQFIPIHQINAAEQNKLVSQGIISKSFTIDPDNFFLFNPSTMAYYIVCDENHLSYKLQYEGFSVTALYEQAQLDVNTIGKSVNFAWSPEFGFITTAIRELGTGMVFSFLIHVPALSLYGVLDSVFRQILETGCEITSKSLSSFGPNGAFFTITMPVLPLGYETVYLNKITMALHSLNEYEKTIQTQLLQTNKVQVYDKIGRSFGLLQYAYEISYDEYVSIMSDIRFGIQTGIIDCTNTKLLSSYILCDPVLLIKNDEEKYNSEAQTRAMQMKKIANYITFTNREIAIV